MADYRQLPWRLVALAALGLAACGGGSDGGPQQLDTLSGTFTLQRVFTDLPPFASPVAMLQAPGRQHTLVRRRAGRAKCAYSTTIRRSRQQTNS